MSDIQNKTAEKIVLVVEDEPALAEAISLKLSQAGVKAITAASGEEALTALKTVRPDLVWLDILLPGINGLEVLRQIRQDPKLKNLPVVVVSVSGGSEKIKQAFSMDVIDYLIKSEYTIDQIIDKARQILQNTAGLP